MKIINVIKDINSKIIFGYKKLYHLESLITKITIINNSNEEIIKNTLRINQYRKLKTNYL